MKAIIFSCLSPSRPLPIWLASLRNRPWGPSLAQSWDTSDSHCSCSSLAFSRGLSSQPTLTRAGEKYSGGLSAAKGTFGCYYLKLFALWTEVWWAGRSLKSYLVCLHFKLFLPSSSTGGSQSWGPFHCGGLRKNWISKHFVASLNCISYWGSLSSPGSCRWVAPTFVASTSRVWPLKARKGCSTLFGKSAAFYWGLFHVTGSKLKTAFHFL